MAIATKDLQSLQNVIERHEELQAQNEQKDDRIAALEAELKEAKQDNKDFEQFRPLLEPVPLRFYKIQLSDSALMKQALGRMKNVYGPRFDRELKDMSDLDAEQTKFIRQCLDSFVLACVRHCVMNTSVFNNMVARYLS
jgi:hypothetical protein